MRTKFYCGLQKSRRVLFATESSNADVLGRQAGELGIVALIGPFKTRRGAQWCVDNPNNTCSSIGEIEAVAKKEKVKL